MTRQLHRTLPLIAAAGNPVWLDRPQPARPVTWTHRSSRSTTRPTPLTSTRSFESQTGRKSLVTALGVYPFEEPGIGPNKFNFDDNVLYEIHVSTGDDVAAGRTDRLVPVPLRDEVQEHRRRSCSRISASSRTSTMRAQNLTQFYTVTKVESSHRAADAPRPRASCPRTIRGTPRRSTTGTTTARIRLRTASRPLEELDRYTQQSIANARSRLRRLRRPARRRLLRRHPGDLRPAQAAQARGRIRRAGSTCT